MEQKENKVRKDCKVREVKAEVKEGCKVKEVKEDYKMKEEDPRTDPYNFFQ